MTTLEKIRTEIKQNMEWLDREAKQTQDDVDCGICIGYQLALNIIDKYDCHGCPICLKKGKEQE